MLMLDICPAGWNRSGWSEKLQKYSQKEKNKWTHWAFLRAAEFVLLSLGEQGMRHTGFHVTVLFTCGQSLCPSSCTLGGYIFVDSWTCTALTYPGFNKQGYRQASPQGYR